MNEKELINKIESLKGIKPNAEWVSLTKDNILGEREERKVFSFQAAFSGFFFRPRALAGAALIFLGGLFLYSQLLVVSDQRRAEELERLTKQKELQMLSIVLAELKEARAEVDRELTGLMVAKPERETVEIVEDIASLLINIEKNEKMVMGSLGVTAEPDKTSVNERTLSFLITDLERRSLTEEDKILLQSAKEAFGVGDHQEALRIILQIGENPEIKDN